MGPGQPGCKRGAQSQAIGRSRVGITSKIIALSVALGNLISFRLLPDQVHDLRGTAALIKGLDYGHLLTDRAFDTDWLRDMLTGTEITAVIPPKSNRR